MAVIYACTTLNILVYECNLITFTISPKTYNIRKLSNALWKFEYLTQLYKRTKHSIIVNHCKGYLVTWGAKLISFIDKTVYIHLFMSVWIDSFRPIWSEYYYKSTQVNRSDVLDWDQICKLLGGPDSILGLHCINTIIEYRWCEYSKT